MKKVLILVMVVAMCFSGCALFGQAKTGVDVVAGQLCNATDTQKQDAAIALAAMDSVQTAVALFIPEANLMKASAVFAMVQQGVCVLLTDLSAALATLDAANQTAAAVSATKGMKATAKILPLASLRAAVQ
jgi:hypothetical protein